MSTSTQSEGTEANLSENTSEQSDGKAKMTVDEYQIVAVAPVEFFTPKRLDHFISKYDDKEKARVETLESYIKELTNFDYKIFVEQIDINDLEKIDGKSPRFDTDKQNKQIEEVINIKEIVNLIERKMSAKKYSENILGREFVDKINESINEFFSDEKTKQNYYLNNIHKIAKENKEELQNLMEYNINYNLWAKLKRKNSKDYFWCELKRQLIATIPQNDKVAIAQIELLIAEAKVGIQQKKPIDQIFGNRYRMSRRSRDLPDVRSVLREAAKELHKHAKYDIDDNFWNELEQNLGNVTLNDDNKTADKIKEVIAEAKANIDARKPIDQIFGNRYSMSRSASDLPDVHTVLSDAERKLRERVKYDDDINLWNEFWNELEQDLGNVTLNDDNKTADKIKEVIAEAKANIDARKPIDQIFGNRYSMSRWSRDLPDVRSVLRKAQEESQGLEENHVGETFLCDLEQKLKATIPQKDKIAVAQINLLIAEAKANIDAGKPIDQIFGDRYRMLRRSRDLPDVRSVLREAAKELHKHAKYDIDDNFWNELEQDLGNVTLNDDNKTADKIEEVIAEAKANVAEGKPIDQIFGDRYSMSRSASDLPDVHTVLSDAERKLRERVKYDDDINLWNKFWNELEQDLGNVTLNDDNKTADKIKEVIAEAKANIDAEKPIDQIFDNRYKMSRSLRDLPDVRSVLRDAERKLHENTNYDIDNDFWDNLKTNLKSVTSDDDKIVAKINESVTEAEANWRDQKSIDKIFGRGGILFPRWQGLPDVRSVLRDAERKLRERVKYDDDINLWNKFWNELEQDLGNVTLNDDNKTADKIKEVIAEAKANIDARKPIDQIFDNRYSMSRSARELPDVHTVLGNFKKRISITYYNDKSKLHRFIKSLEKGIESLNDELLSYDKLIFEVYRRVNEKLEVFGNKLTPLDTKQDDTNNHKIQENLEKINRDSNIEDNINKIEDMLRNTPSEEMEEMEAKIYEKLNELYNFSAFNDNDNSNAYDKNTKNYFLDKLPKYLLIEEILSDPKFELDASNIKSVDILVAIPRNPNNEKTTTEIVFLLVIDINLEENRELVPEDFKIGEMLFDPFNVRTILNLVFNRFFIENKESHFNKLLDNKSFISNSSILHIISCPNFGTDDNTQELSWRQKDFIKEIIPGLLFDHVNPENSELKYIHRKNFKSSDAGGVSSALVLYLKQLLAISDQNSLAPEDNRDKVIGLQIVLQVFLQRLIQFNDALRSIAIEENRKNLFDGKDDFKMFSNQLHYTYTISDEVINSSRQHSDIAVLRDLLASDTIINQIKIFKERRQTFFSTKENFENWQRDSIIQWSLVGLAVITIVFSILELSNKADFVKLLIALGIISFLAVIFMWKFSVFKKIKHIYTSIKSKIFSK